MNALTAAARERAAVPRENTEKTFKNRSVYDKTVSRGKEQVTIFVDIE